MPHDLDRGSANGTGARRRLGVGVLSVLSGQ
ncbi:hypothetical protein QFZ77_002994 [Paenibacillus sp. V4I3]|nr:hypothetical protein [Paenibacillus sp. V4I3]MDQ0888548.1 hypothetical protein [Paenibacillus sp. V4I9]